MIILVLVDVWVRVCCATGVVTVGEDNAEAEVEAAVDAVVDEGVEEGVEEGVVEEGVEIGVILVLFKTERLAVIFKKELLT